MVNLTLDAKHQGDEIWAIGGGCLLPGFKKLLEKNGFKILDNPVEANVSGLINKNFSSGLLPSRGIITMRILHGTWIRGEMSNRTESYAKAETITG